MTVSNTQRLELNFDRLFEIALQDWPEEIDLEIIEYPDQSEKRYTVKGLGLLAERIEERYIDTSTEVIARNLHDAIYSAVHGVARFCTCIRLLEIRKEIVKKDFESRLFDALDNQALGWLEEDIEIVRNYFKIQGNLNE